MINDILTYLSTALSSSWWIAVIASFLWGILSILLSPCHLSSIPLIIAYITRKEVKTVNKSFQISLLFSIGILFSLALIGLITALLGRILGDIGSIVNYIIPIILIIAGLILLDIFNISFLERRIKLPHKFTGTFFTLLLGLTVGVGLGPCTFAFIAPILAIVFSSASSSLFFPILLLGSFSIGHCLTISLAGILTKKVQNVLNLSEKGKPLWIFKKLCGILLIVLGLYFIFFY